MYSEFKFENIKDQNFNYLRQNFVITWEQEITNCFLNNVLLGNVLVIVHIHSFPLCARHTKLSLRVPPASFNTLLTITLARVSRYVKIKLKDKREISFENLYDYISSYHPLNFCSGVNAFIESLNWCITSLERSHFSGPSI